MAMQQKTKRVQQTGLGADLSLLDHPNRGFKTAHRAILNNVAQKKGGSHTEGPFRVSDGVSIRAS